MISFEQALQTVLEESFIKESEHVSLEKAYGRVLSGNIISDIDMPPFNKSAVDGYACRSADRDIPLEVIETVSAGSNPQKEINAGECAKVMTGAKVPSGANCVVMVEHTQLRDERVYIVKNSNNANICIQGEDVKKGDMVLEPGVSIGPAQIAVLASVGCSLVPVIKQLRVGTIATGNELVEPDMPLQEIQIRNSNSYQLGAQIFRAGALPHYYGLANDAPEAIAALIEETIGTNDIILISGGVSMGDYDFVPGVLRSLGVAIQFEKIAIQPGKPTVFGTKDGKYFFGLPGNPVSTFVMFELLVRPLINACMGKNKPVRRIRAQLGSSLRRKRADRKSFLPVYLDDQGVAHPVEYHGSAHINAFLKADGVIAMEQEVLEVAANADVEVFCINFGT